MQCLREKLNRSVPALFAVLYSGIFVLIMFFNSSFAYRPLFQMVLLVIWAIVLATAIWLWHYVRDFLKQYKYRVLLIALTTLVAVQILLTMQTVPNPMYDHGKVFQAASHYAKYGTEGDFFISDTYLHHFPNNMGQFLVLQFVFRLTHFVGIDADYMTAAVAGHLLFALALGSGFVYLDDAFDTDTAFGYLLVAVLYLPVYFQTMVSYTDTWSIWVAPCVLLCGHKMVKAQKWYEKLLWGALSGLTLGIGTQIKITAAIIAIALLLQWLLQGNLKKVLLPVLAMLLVFIAVTVGFRQWKYATILDPAREDEGMPVTHWLMMGLQMDGSYSWMDEWNISAPIDTKEERIRVNLEVIQERLQEMGPIGYIRLLGRKTCRSFGSGNADLRYSLLYENDAKPINLLYEFVFEDGRYYAVFNNVSHSMYLMMLLLAIAAAIFSCREERLRQQSALYLGLIGFWIFMMLWESNHRQWINQWPLLFMAAAVGLRCLEERSPVLLKKISGCSKKKTNK